MANIDTDNREPQLLIRVKDQSGGINTRTYATEIRDNQAQEINDAFVEPGIVKKREGTTNFSTAPTSSPVRGVVDFKPDIAASQVLMFATEDKVYSVDSSGITSLRATVGTSGNETEFIQALNKVYVSNGADRPLIFDTSLNPSSVASGPTTLTKFTTGDYFLNRLWINDVDNKSHVRFSNILADDFDTSINTFKFGEGSGNSEIIKIQGFRNQELLVFMNNRIEELLIIDPGDDSTWVRRVLDDRYGLLAKDSVIELAGSIFFLDNEKRVRAFQRTALDAPAGTQALAISDPIQTFLDRINTLQIAKVSAGAKDNFYLIAVPLDSSAENNAIFAYDVTLQSWVGPWDLSAAKFVRSDIRAQEQELFFGSSSAGQIVRMFDGTSDDNGSSFEVKIITKKYDFNAPESDKTFNEIEIAVLATGSGTVTVDARVDETGFTNVGSFIITGSGPTLPVNLPFNLGGIGIVRAKFHLESFSRGRNIDFRFTHKETGDIQIIEWIPTVLDENYESENI